ncbi:MAG: hypothetical protein HC806_02605 [Anaerolineae bacterium]|nr:hypothetical protein [Anaerolineae bacterium]
MFATEDIYDYSVEEALEAGRENKLKPGYLDVMENPKYYGISLDITQGFPFKLGLFATFIGLFLLRKEKLAQFIVSSFIVLGLAVFPYTGWMIGLATSPFQLWRLTWLMPFGLAIAFLFDTLFKYSLRLPHLSQLHSNTKDWALIGTQLVMVAGFFYIMPWAQGNLKVGGTKPGTTIWYQDYIELSEVLNSLEPQGEILVGGSDRPTNDIIPSLTYNVNLLSFRNERGGGNADIWEAVISPNTSSEDRFKLIKSHNIRYLLIRDGSPWLTNWIDNNPERFELLHENRKLQIYFISSE